MTTSAHDDPRATANAGGLTSCGEARAAVELPPAAQRTLKRIADALGVTPAFLGRVEAGPEAQTGEMAGLAEASALLHAFVRIEDPWVRQRCLDFVRAASREQRIG